MTRTYEGSHQQNETIAETNVMVPMRDGVSLSTDVYFPAVDGVRAEGEFPVILERTPYDNSVPNAVTKAKFFARRGYVCAVQDVRGRFESEGEWYPFAREAPDGYDTVEWLATQAWSNGKVGTMGDSYCGSDQAALATLDPPHLSTMIVAVGASNYHHSSMRHNGALEQRFLIYAFRMAAVGSHEANEDAALDAALTDTFAHHMPEIVDRFPLIEGTTILRRVPTYERWAIDLQTRGNFDEYWRQRGYAPSEYYEESADVPTLYLGGWYDSYARNTTESYMALSRMKSSPQHLLMGPWTHGGYEVTYSGDLDFGAEAHINYLDLKLAWFDHYLKEMHTEVAEWSPVRIFTMGTGDGKSTTRGAPGAGSGYPEGHINHGGYWRNEADWPVPGTIYTPYYLHGDGTLSTQNPEKSAGFSSEYTYDPDNPVSTIGGGISAANDFMPPGGFDQRGRPGFYGCTDTLPLNTRPDVLTFQSCLLENDVEITGPIEMHLWASSSAKDTDFTAKLIDVHAAGADFADGLAINISDSIIRARYRNGFDKPELLTPGRPYEFVFQLYPTSNIFRRGHRIRLDISSSNWPRFDKNPNTGGPLGLDRDVRVARQTVYHNPECPSHVILPLQNR